MVHRALLVVSRICRAAGLLPRPAERCLRPSLDRLRLRTPAGGWVLTCHSPTLPVFPPPNLSDTHQWRRNRTVRRLKKILNFNFKNNPYAAEETVSLAASENKLLSQIRLQGQLRLIII